MDPTRALRLRTQAEEALRAGRLHKDDFAYLSDPAPNVWADILFKVLAGGEPPMVPEAAARLWLAAGREPNVAAPSRDAFVRRVGQAWSSEHPVEILANSRDDGTGRGDAAARIVRGRSCFRGAKRAGDVRRPDREVWFAGSRRRCKACSLTSTGRRS